MIELDVQLTVVRLDEEPSLGAGFDLCIDGELVAVDYLANARSLGARTFDAPDERSLRAALRDARAEKSTCFIRVKTLPGAPIPGFSWWDVPVAETSAKPKDREARENYEQSIKNQKFYY